MYEHKMLWVFIFLSQWLMSGGNIFNKLWKIKSELIQYVVGSQNGNSINLCWSTPACIIYKVFIKKKKKKKNLIFGDTDQAVY